MDKSTEKMIKTWLEFGVGMTYITVDALNEAMKKLEKDGKINRTESKRIVQEVMSKYKSKGSKYTKDAQAQINQIMKDMPFATKKEIADLNKRIDIMTKAMKKAMK